MYTIDLAVAEDGSRYHCVPLTKKGDIAYDYAVMLGADFYGGSFSLPQDSTLIRDMIEQGVVLKIGRAVHRLATE
jgi:hypothetical protein